MPDESRVPAGEAGADALAARGKWSRRALIPMILGATTLVATLVVLDALHHGPYATWFNRRCQRLADESGLVGRPESDVVLVLGPPTSGYAGDDDSRRTYNYAPWPILPTAKFQVHCRGGFVDSVEQFDD